MLITGGKDDDFERHLRSNAIAHRLFKCLKNYVVNLLKGQNMAQIDYNLLKLWPDFSRLFSGEYTSPEGLSAAIVAFLFITFLSFFIYSLFKYFGATHHLRFYRRLLQGLAVDQLLERRREIVNKALEKPDYGKLWREFDESLVHVPQKNRLCNTLDAAHFFNTHTLARGLTENRLLAAVPGFLTAIGVIGTFAGLQLNN